MTRALLLPLALGALVPVMIGPAPAGAGTQGLAVTLCGGGTLLIPLGPGKVPGDEDRGCHPKGCHAGTCRPKDEQKRPDRTN